MPIVTKSLVEMLRAGRGGASGTRGLMRAAADEIERLSFAHALVVDGYNRALARAEELEADQ